MGSHRSSKAMAPVCGQSFGPSTGALLPPVRENTESGIGGIGRLLDEDPPCRNQWLVTQRCEAAPPATRNWACYSKQPAVELLVVLWAAELPPSLPVPDVSKSHDFSRSLPEPQLCLYRLCSELAQFCSPRNRSTPDCPSCTEPFLPSYNTLKQNVNQTTNQWHNKRNAPPSRTAATW